MIVTKEIREIPASKLGVEEKVIETWLAERPKLLFPKEDILVIGQSISGKRMADIIALDSIGNLITIEIKRDWSDRVVVAQLLEYAAKFHNIGYDQLNDIAQAYSKWEGGELISAFCKFSDREEFPKEKLGENQRIYIVAPDSDTGLKNIVEWLQDYGVPIEFIPFSLYGDDLNHIRYISIEPVEFEIEKKEVDRTWAGHWLFNTNERYCKGAYKRMFENNVIAIYGYETGPKTLEGTSEGEKVFAYVNQQGIRALGTILDSNVVEGKGIFLDEEGNQSPDEYHVKVKWDCVLPREKALTNSEAMQMDYNLPAVSAFSRLRRGTIANVIEKEIIHRSKEL